MKKLSCKIGEKFGYWEVIDNTPVSKSGHTYVMVKCKCGKELLKCLSDLKNGRSTGCKSCKARERSRDIHIGDKYKKWTVIDGPKTSNHNCIIWKVQCDCGTERWMLGNELTNPNSCFECLKCSGLKRGQNLSAKSKVGELTATKYGKIKRAAESRGIVFSVSKEFLWNLFLAQNKICAITGDKLLSINSASLDRIDSNKGYIEGNVQWTTQLANLSKHTMTMQELYIFCEKVLNHANQQPSQPLTKLEGSETNS